MVSSISGESTSVTMRSLCFDHVSSAWFWVRETQSSAALSGLSGLFPCLVSAFSEGQVHLLLHVLLVQGIPGGVPDLQYCLRELDHIAVPGEDYPFDSDVDLCFPQPLVYGNGSPYFGAPELVVSSLNKAVSSGSGALIFSNCFASRRCFFPAVPPALLSILMQDSNVQHQGGLLLVQSLLTSKVFF